jgi:hypothetical protein
LCQLAGVGVGVGVGDGCGVDCAAAGSVNKTIKNNERMTRFIAKPSLKKILFQT